ncbi:MAG: hypothetical protein Q8O95_04245 [bacterium]|nr:hypothetical protein [bacterium]
MTIDGCGIYSPKKPAGHVIIPAGFIQTFREPTTGQITRAKEVYRDLEILEKDLGYLIQRAIRLGLNKLDIYMSNLDVFQSPDQLLDFARVCKGLKRQYPEFLLNLRGLATVDSFLRARDTKKESIEELTEAGFHTVGFGIDGMTPQVWKAIKKGHMPSLKTWFACMV